MSKQRQHTRHSPPHVLVDSPLIDCRLVNLSTSGLAIETSVGLRLGVPYPFRLRDGEQALSTEATVRWCRLVRNETVDGESRPVYRAGAAFVEWLTQGPEEPQSAFEQQIDDALDQWMEQSRTTPDRRPAPQHTIVRHAPRWQRPPDRSGA
jgi:hypothetical protein